MKEIQPRKRTDWVTRGVLIGALAVGTGAFVDHEQKQEQQIQFLKNDVQNLKAENTRLWANGCFVQAEADELLQGETDIAPDRTGLEKCKEYADKWIEIFNREGR